MAIPGFKYRRLPKPLSKKEAGISSPGFQATAPLIPIAVMKPIPRELTPAFILEPPELRRTIHTLPWRKPSVQFEYWTRFVEWNQLHPPFVIAVNESLVIPDTVREPFIADHLDATTRRIGGQPIKA